MPAAEKLSDDASFGYASMVLGVYMSLFRSLRNILHRMLSAHDVASKQWPLLWLLSQFRAQECEQEVSWNAT